MNIKRQAGKIAVIVSLLGALAIPGFSTPVTGELNISGGWTVGAGTIDFDPLGPGGSFVLIGPQTGTFSGAAFSGGSIVDLDAGVQPTNTDLSVGTGTGTGSMFLSTFTGLGLAGIYFDLNLLPVGTGSAAVCGAAPAAGQICTPSSPGAGSPFNLTNITASSSTATFRVFGEFVSSIGERTEYVGSFTSQFPNQNFQELLAIISSGGTVDASWSATFTPIPEPGTVSMLLLSGMFFGAYGLLRRRTRR